MGSKKSAVFIPSTWNLYLREIIFVTDVGVLTIETLLIERKARVKTGLTETQFRQFHFLKPLDTFMRLLKYANKVRLRKR